MSITHHAIDQMWDASRIAAAFGSADGQAICAAGRAFGHTIEDRCTLNPRQQSALRFVDAAVLAAIASLADTGG